jgi:hypothetical protein
VDTGIWNKVSLEFSKVDIECTIETKRGSKRGNDLTNEPVEVGVGWAFDIEGTAAKIIEGFVIDHESAIRVVNHGMGSKNGVVWLNNSSGNLWSWIDSEFKL